jgi:hypothetical protein
VKSEERLAREIMVIEEIAEKVAVKKLEMILVAA